MFPKRHLRGMRDNCVTLRASPSLRPTEVVASGSRLMGVAPILLAYLMPLLLLLLPFPGQEKELWDRERKRKCENSELEHWRVTGAEAGTSLGKRLGIWMILKASGSLGPAPAAPVAPTHLLSQCGEFLAIYKSFSPHGHKKVQCWEQKLYTL